MPAWAPVAWRRRSSGRGPTPRGATYQSEARLWPPRRAALDRSRASRLVRRDQGERASQWLVLRDQEAGMSEQGWREFLAAEGVDDWVVLHGGATAVFRVPSLGEAAQLVEAVAQLPGVEGSGIVLTVTDGCLSVRLTRGVFRLEERHIALARAVSAIARAHG